MLPIRKTFTLLLVLGLFALAPLETVRADDTDAPKGGASAAKLKLSDLAPGKGKGKAQLLRRRSERRAKKAEKSPAQPTTKQADSK